MGWLYVFYYEISQKVVNCCISLEKSMKIPKLMNLGKPLIKRTQTTRERLT